MTFTSDYADCNGNKYHFIPPSQWGDNITVDKNLVERNLQDIEKEIAPCKPRIIAVTKYFGLNAIVSGYEVGLRDFGESRAVDAVKKIKDLPNEIKKNSTFHFIGHLQTNKVEMVVNNFDIIQSVDSLKLANKISECACKLNKKMRVLLQVNISGEEQKYGYSREELIQDIKKIVELPMIDVIGLMTMAPITDNEKYLKEVFSELRTFRDSLETKFCIKLPELSMGMSNDYKLAIESGATMIRLGRKLFK